MTSHGGFASVLKALGALGLEAGIESSRGGIMELQIKQTEFKYVDYNAALFEQVKERLVNCIIENLACHVEMPQNSRAVFGYIDSLLIGSFKLGSNASVSAGLGVSAGATLPTTPVRVDIGPSSRRSTGIRADEPEGVVAASFTLFRFERSNETLYMYDDHLCFNNRESTKNDRLKQVLSWLKVDQNEVTPATTSLEVTTAGTPSSPMIHGTQKRSISRLAWRLLRRDKLTPLSKTATKYSFRTVQTSACTTYNEQEEKDRKLVGGRVIPLLDDTGARDGTVILEFAMLDRILGTMLCLAISRTLSRQSSSSRELRLLKICSLSSTIFLIP